MPGMPVNIVGHNSEGQLEAQVLRHHDGDHVGLMVLTDPLVQFNPETHFFLNDTFGSAMNQNIGFSGTPEIIHNGGSSVEWTGAAIQGTWDFADVGKISLTAANNNDAATFSEESPTTIGMGGYTTLTGKINLSLYGDVNNTLSVIFDLAGVPVGNSVNIDDYIDTGLVGIDQNFIIPKADLGLTTQDVDGFTILLTRTGGVKPTMTFDDIQLEQTGASAVFVSSTPIGTIYHIDSIRISIVDDITGITPVAGATENATMTGLAYDKILGLSRLTNGIIFRRVQGGVTQFSTTLHQIEDFLAIGGTIVNSISDGINACVIVDILFPRPIILEGNGVDNELSLTVSDDLSGLISFTAVTRGALEVESHT